MCKVLLLLLLISITLFLFWPSRIASLFYYPDRISYGTPADQGLRYEEVTFESLDGTRLSGWFVPARGTPRGTVIHFHGNAENMTSHFAFVSWLPAQGFNVFVFDYRGYGESEGKPERKGIYEDCVAALSYISSRKDIDATKLLVLGQSLGGSNAIAALGANRFSGVRGVAIESAFASYRGIVKEKIGEMPLLSIFRGPLSHLLIDDAYSADQVVDRISPVPLLLIYAMDDPIVSVNQGRRLYAKAREPKEFWTVQGGHHLETFADDSSPYREKLVHFYLKCLAGTSASKPVE